MTTKKCHACGAEKDAKDFYKSSSSKDGLAPSCKDCQNGKTGATPAPKPKVVPGAYAKSMKKTAKLENQAQRAKFASMSSVVSTAQTPTTRQEAPTEEPEELGETYTGMIRAKDTVWWLDPNRDKRWAKYPRACWVISVNQENKTAIIETFADMGNRVEERFLVQTSELRRRIIHY